MLSVEIQLLYPHHGFVEIDEMLIWQQAQDVIIEAISSKDLFCLWLVFWTGKAGPKKPF